VRLPISRAHGFTLPVAAAWLILAAAPAVAQPGYRDLVTVDYGMRFQPPTLRLDAMGGLGLAVRDEYTELNLWDFAGLPLALPEDRDSTSLDLWLGKSGVSLDRLESGVHHEVDRFGATNAAGEVVLRSGRSAIGADFGFLSVHHGLPFADSEHVADKVSQPAVRPVATGRLWRGLRWGLAVLLGQEKTETTWWHDEVTGDRVKLLAKGLQIAPPSQFTTDEGKVGISGTTASLGYRHPRWGSVGLYYDRRWERIRSNLDANRSIYELSEPRDWTGYGAAAIVAPRESVEVGLMAGREYYRGLQEFRFTTSGGSNAEPLTARGNRQRDDGRQDFVQARILGDVPGLPITFGGALKVAYAEANQDPAVEPDGSDFNSFVLLRAAGDTASAPQLVEYLHQTSRRVEWGMGASYRFLSNRATVGLEYRSQRDARVGSEVLRRAKDWQVSVGGQYDVTEHWSGFVGYRHGRSDYDTFTLLNENLVDRFSVGAAGEVMRKWRVQCEVSDEWHRTDYPDPGELGGSGLGFGLQLTRGF
jgi:hypothetical protein